MPEFDLAFGDENPLAKQIREALGVGDYEKVRVVTPQFERTDGKTIKYFPKTEAEFDALKKAPKDILIDIGLKLWDKGHWLYPGEWYDFIPEGYPITDINGVTEPFRKGKTDNDIRFGCLAYGFKRDED
jgi:hypothetical protein